MTTDLILGTAGHIDHGKTTLVRALTGTDTDRLPEEKRRGITIELGFAELVAGEFRLGIVDVPGHERFIRNMLCGATGVDLALLVVAADDSVKQQTREHLDILRLLDLSAGVIALTKVDLVDPGWLELVVEEVRELVRGTFLERAPVIPTSAATGLGIDALRDALVEAANRVVATRRDTLSGPFRMAIDRSFSIAGHGTVVTGSVSSGKCEVGDELMIEPGSVPVRVRALQNHDRTVSSVHHGQRAAINLAGIHHQDLGRGQELCTPGHLQASKLLTAWLEVLPSSPRPLKNRTRLKLHVGTAELAATVRLLDRESLEPGSSGPCQLFVSEPTVTVWNQPLVIRFESPARTVGGGHVLDPHAERIRHPDSETLTMIQKLRGPNQDQVARASAALYFAGLRDWQPADLARTAGVDNYEFVAEKLLEGGDLREIPVSPTRIFRVHRLVLARLHHRIDAALRRLHELYPLKLAHDRRALDAGFRYLGGDAILNTALRDMQAAGQVKVSPRGIALAGCGPKLTPSEQKTMSQLVEMIRAGGPTPPFVKECQQQLAKHADTVPSLLNLAVANGELVEVSNEFYLDAGEDQRQRQLLAQKMAGGQGLTVSEIREILNVSRKYAVPYCEYLDRIGFTQRSGDVRRLCSPDVGVESVLHQEP